MIDQVGKQPVPLHRSYRALNATWGGVEPRPEIKLTFLLGIVEGLALCASHKELEILDAVNSEVQTAIDARLRLPWWKKWFIKV